MEYIGAQIVIRVSVAVDGEDNLRNLEADTKVLADAVADALGVVNGVGRHNEPRVEVERLPSLEDLHALGLRIDRPEE